MTKIFGSDTTNAVHSKHAGSNSHPILISLEALARSRLDDSCTPALFWTRSIWPKPDSQPELNWIQAGFPQYDPGCLWMKPSQKVGNWSQASCILPEIRPNESCTPTCFQTRCIWWNLDQAIQIGSGSVLDNTIHTLFGKTELKQMWEVRSGIYIYSPAWVWLHSVHN